MNAKIAFLIGVLWSGWAWAAGTLQPIGSPEAPIEIVTHHVDVVINNGFSKTTVTQAFFNPNADALEAVYTFPVPKSASLSEMTVILGESEIHGEVVPAKDAEQIYEAEKQRGNDAGLGKKDAFETYSFAVYPVLPDAETTLRFVYYQPLEIDTGVGRYQYPLEDGGTDEAAVAFWTRNEQVEDLFSIHVELKTSWPVVGLRMPGFDGIAQVDQRDPGHYVVDIDVSGGSLNRDFVFYYQLAEDLPGSLEMLAYKPAPDQDGTFMLIVTPGLDLKPITGGRDTVFILDISGSMDGKLSAMTEGVAQAMGQFGPEDRFRVVVFSDRTREVIPWTPATPTLVKMAIDKIKRLQTQGDTNLYDGLNRGLTGLDDDRASQVILITDAVTNTGIVDPKEFHKLLSQYDIRLFGFLMGNSGNWPLMRLIAETTGGFYANVSNADDIIGQVLLAKSKVTHECLHGAELRIDGVDTFATSDTLVGKVYRGQQLVFFGRYRNPGRARLSLNAQLTGQDKTYTTEFEFPEVADEHPELERLWALHRIEQTQGRIHAGLLPEDEGADIIERLGIDYQLVTDHTSMLVLDDATFDEYGIDRRNLKRVQLERDAQALRKDQPIVSHRVDQHAPMFSHQRPSLGSGGGAFGPFALLAAVLLAVGTAWKQRKV